MGTTASTLITNDVNDNGKVVRRFTLTGSASYATGGDTLDIGNLGIRRVDKFYVDGATAANGYHLGLAGTAAVPLIKYFKGAGAPAEETNATNLSAVVALVEVHGFA